MPVLTGGKTRLNVQFEGDTYGTAESSPNPFVPGANCILTTKTATNNGQRVTLPASQTTVDIVPGMFDGAWALEYGLMNPWFFRSIYGSPSSAGSDPTTHTYSLGEPDSFQILLGYEEDTNDEETLKGCVTARWACNPTVEDGAPIPCVAEGFYAKAPSIAEDTTLTSQDTLDFDEIQFGDLTLKLGGSAEAIVQNAALELAWDPIQPVMAFGSRFATDFMTGLFTPNIQYDKVRQNGDAIQDVYGGSTSMQEDVENQQKVELLGDNGKSSGSGINEIKFIGDGNSFPESHDDAPLGDPRQRIDETLNRLIENLNVEAVNDTATAL